MWYYLSSCANAGCGNNILARDHAAQAVNMGLEIRSTGSY